MSQGKGRHSLSTSMDQATLVEHQIDDVSKLVDELKLEQLGVSAVFWLYASEADQWFLYLVSDVVDQQGITEAYRILYKAMRRLTNLSINRFEVKLVGPDEPVAKAIIDVVSEQQVPLPTWEPAANGSFSLDGTGSSRRRHAMARSYHAKASIQHRRPPRHHLVSWTRPCGSQAGEQSLGKRSLQRDARGLVNLDLACRPSRRTQTSAQDWIHSVRQRIAGAQFRAVGRVEADHVQDARSL